MLTSKLVLVSDVTPLTISQICVRDKLPPTAADEARSLPTTADQAKMLPWDQARTLETDGERSARILTDGERAALQPLYSGDTNNACHQAFQLTDEQRKVVDEISRQEFLKAKDAMNQAKTPQDYQAADEMLNWAIADSPRTDEEYLSGWNKAVDRAQSQRNGLKR
jgi:hypothetical protein